MSTTHSPLPPAESTAGHTAHRMLDVAAVAAKYGCDQRTVYRWANDGLIPFGVKLCGLRRWSLAEIDSHIASGCPRVH